MTRTDIEFLYLLSARCFFNMSPINNEIERNKTSIAMNMADTVKDLYHKVVAKFTEYSKKLKKEEDKIGEMISDRFTRMFKKESYHEKEKILIGIEYNHEYSIKGVQGKKADTEDFGDFDMEQQIKFTVDNYIPGILVQLEKKSRDFERQIELLKSYQTIFMLKRDEKKSFKERVNEIIFDRQINSEFKKK